ncbi:MAG TPA: type I methionyl aminopeptidase [Bacillota bacterium]|nr:type I methionyl aminopeptidase [Bacillota bacterium]
MIVRKSAQEVARMRKVGQMVASILCQLAREVKPGVTTGQLNKLAEDLCKQRGVIPAFKGYNGFPAGLCASVNEVVVHGIPGALQLKAGDIIGLDFGVILEGYYGDAALTVPVGEIAPDVQRLLQVTKEALHLGIAQARPGNWVSDISRAIQNHVETNGFSVVREFVGHGIGHAMHEEPQIPNFVAPLSGYDCKLKSGMTLAIEPMVNMGSYQVTIDPIDHWTVRTIDRKYSAHFEHTVLVTDGDPEILTVLPAPEESEWSW